MKELETRLYKLVSVFPLSCEHKRTNIPPFVQNKAFEKLKWKITFGQYSSEGLVYWDAFNEATYFTTYVNLLKLTQNITKVFTRLLNACLSPPTCTAMKYCPFGVATRHTPKHKVR